MAASTSSASASDPLAPWLARHLDVRLVARSPVGGGCIHSAWSLTLADGGRLFAKSGPLAALTLLEAEADGLVALAAAADPQRLVVLVPLALGQVEEQAVLVLPWLDLGSSGGQGDPWRGLGASLAALHRRSLEGPLVAGDRGGLAFGWGRDNHIGSTPQANGWLEDWGRFFVERRLAPQVDRFVRREGPLPGASALLERVPQWLAAHRPEPCLVHGDLWSGNAGHLGDGRGRSSTPRCTALIGRWTWRWPACSVGFPTPSSQDMKRRGPCRQATSTAGISTTSITCSTTPICLAAPTGSGAGA